MSENFLDEFKKLSNSGKNALICEDEIYTWRNYYELSINFAKNILEYNCQKKSIAIISNNCPKYYISIMGTIIAGSIYTGIFPTSSSDEIKHIIETSETEILCVQNYNILNSFSILFPLKLIILFDDEPIDSLYQSIKIINVKDLFYNKSNNLLPIINQSDIINYVFTSGTTGKSKCVMRSYDFYKENTKKIVEIFDMKNEKTISYLPSSHVFDLDLILFPHFLHQGEIHFSKNNITNSTNNFFNFIELIKPTMLIGVPRIWEKINENKEWEKLKKCRLPICSGAVLSPEIEQSFLQNNIKIFIMYGMSETGLISANNSENNMTQSVGKIYSRSLKIAPDREILCKNKFCGYKNNPDANAEFKDSEGWLHTGDCGIIEKEFLFIIGRKKELIITSTGKKINPNKIENKIKILLPNINNLILVGDIQKFLSLLIFNKQTSNVEIEKAINSYNLNADCHSETIQKYLVINDDLTTENGFLTKSLKLRRNEIINHYKEKINKFYK